MKTLQQLLDEAKQDTGSDQIYSLSALEHAIREELSKGKVVIVKGKKFGHDQIIRTFEWIDDLNFICCFSSQRNAKYADQAFDVLAADSIEAVEDQEQ